jgi:hypothetical protein
LALSILTAKEEKREAFLPSFENTCAKPYIAAIAGYIKGRC